MLRNLLPLVLCILLSTPLLSPQGHAEMLPTGGWVGFGDGAGVRFGYAVAPAGDINADGYADILISAPWHDGPGLDYGRVYCYWGSAAGIDDHPTLFDGTQSSAEFGVAVSSAGDINNDGYDDIAIGAPKAGFLAPQMGELWVYLGSDDGMTLDYHTLGPAAYAWYATSLAPAGDVNGDGYDDLLVGAPGENSERGVARVLRGSATGIAGVLWSYAPLTPAGHAGTVVAGAGDVNADGYADIAVADTLGNVAVFHGSAAGPSLTPDYVLQGQAGSSFGASVAGAGDVNGDGYGDLVVGAPKYTNPDVNEGIVYIFHGGLAGLDSDPDWSFEGDSEESRVGCSVATAGDANGDGYADIAASAPYASLTLQNEGYWMLRLGGADTMPLDFAARGGQEAAYDGWRVATAGDVNGDGSSDLIVAAPFYDEDGLADAGRVTVYEVTLNPPSVRALFNAWGGQAQAGEGSAVTLGDFDGDGFADAASGGGGYDGPGLADAGRVRVFRGATTGIEETASWTALGATAGEIYGASIAGNGDVNNDGYEDLLVGAPGHDAQRGRALLYLGTPSGLYPVPGWSSEGEDAGDGYGTAVAFVGDVNGDGFCDAAVGAPTRSEGGAENGKAYLYWGRYGGLSPEPTWTDLGGASDAHFGASLAGAGDVDADGYADLVVGAPDYFQSSGGIYIYRGQVEGPASYDWAFWGEHLGDRLGAAVASAGDLDADGYSDVVAGIPGWDTAYQDNGAVRTYFGGAGDLEPALYPIVTPVAADTRAGSAVAAADLNGDGRSDLLVGAPGASNGQAGEGQVWLYHSYPSWYDRHWIADGDIVGAAHGSAIATGRDISGDGFPDVLTGMPGATQSAAAEGAAALWPGNGKGLPPNNLTYGLDRSPKILQWHGDCLVSHGGQSQDPNRVLSSVHARTPMGRGSVRLEFEPALPGEDFDGFGTIRSLIYNSGSPQPGTGSGVTIEQMIPYLSADSRYRWRMRILGDGVYWKHSRWFTPPGNAPTEMDFRTPADASHAEPLADARGRVRLTASPSTILDRTTLAFELPREEQIELRIHDVTGRCLATLFEGRSPAGLRTVSWTGADQNGARLAAGIYFAVLRAGEATRSVPVVIAR